MTPSPIGQLPRLARTLISRLLDQEAAVVSVEQPVGAPENALGQIVSVIWRKNEVTLSGRHAADRTTVAIDGQPEHDLTTSPFQITLPRLHPEARLRVTCVADTASESLYLAPPDEQDARHARRLALPGVLLRIFGERRDILQYLRTGNPNTALAIRRRLGLTDLIEGTYVPSTLFGPSEPRRPHHPPAIVVPVFNAFSDLDRLLARFPEAAGCAHHLVLVDDGSDDARVAERLAQHSAEHPDNCTLISFPENRGFVAAANAGIAAARNRKLGHIILLNSDALPPDGWVPRLLAPIERDNSVASVTPMSNAAEILSVPRSGAQDLPSLAAVQKVDRVAESLSARFASAEVPTGVGFCMALNRRFVDRLDPFDPAFGRGYGEEVDWCQRARLIGGRHFGIASLFVGHRGSASFGAEEKAALVRRASAEIARRYPAYDTEVQTWCARDPLAPARLALTIAWLGAETDHAIPVFFAHSLGGGAETALTAEIAEVLGRGCPGVVILRVGGPRPWRLEVQTQDTRQIGEILSQEQVLRFLMPLHARKIIYSCGVGAAEPASVPRFLLRLLQPGVSFEMRLHDFFPISPSWNLLGSDGRFHGIPDKDTRDPAHRVDGRNPLIHRDWRLLWSAVVRQALEITVFSQSSSDLFAQAYPEAKARVALRPHQLEICPEPMAPGGSNVGVLGNINRAKGGAVLTALGAAMSDRKLFVLGEMDGQYRLAPPHAVHGGYERREISQLARGYGIGLWLIPSICPETFSFATHEALATGLPVLGFDLGAQGEALAAAPNGHVLPYAPADIPALLSRIDALFADQTDTRFRSAS